MTPEGDESIDINELSRSLRKKALEPAGISQRTAGEFARSTRGRSSLSEVPGALFRQENMLGSGYQRFLLNSRLSGMESQPDFNYADWIGDNAPDMVRYRDRFVWAESPDMAQAIADKIRYEEQSREIMAEHPFASFGLGLIIGSLDPSILVPGGTIVKNARTGARIAKSALSVGSASALSGAIQEVGLYNTQESRTVEESAFNIFGNAVFGASVGTLIAAKSPIAKAIQHDITSTYAGTNESLTPMAPGETLSAARYSDEYLQQSKQFANVGGLVSKGIKGLNPILRLGNSEFTSAQTAGEILLGGDIVRNKNLPEYGAVPTQTSLQTHIKNSMARFDLPKIEMQEQFFKNAGVESGPLKSFRSNFSQQGLSSEDFGQQITFAARNGGVHENRFVAAASRIFLEKIVYPIRDEAIALKLLPENVSVETAVEYVTRLWNHEKIKENQAEFTNEKIIPWITGQNELLKSYQPYIKQGRNKISAFKTIATRQKSRQKRLEILKSRASGDIEAVSNTLKEKQLELKTFVEKKRGVLDDRAEKNLDRLIGKEEQLDKLSNQFEKTQTERINEIDKILEKEKSLKTEIDQLKARRDELVSLERQELEGRLEKLRRQTPAQRGTTIAEAKAKTSKKIKDIKEKHKKSIDEKSSALQKLKDKVKTKEAALKSLEKKHMQKVAAQNKELRSLERTLDKLESKDEIITRKEIQLEKERMRASARAATKGVREIERLEASLKKKPVEQSLEELSQVEAEFKKGIPKTLFDSDGNIRNVLDGEDHIASVAHDTVMNILSRNSQKIKNPVLNRYMGTGKPKPLKNRDFLIPDELIQDWTINDAFKIADSYTRAMVPVIETAKLGRRLGVPEKNNERIGKLQDQKFALQEKLAEPGVTEAEVVGIETKIAEIDQKIDEIGGVTEDVRSYFISELTNELNAKKEAADITPARARKLEKEYDSNVQDINAGFDMLFGVYGAGPNTIDNSGAVTLRALRAWNYLRFMGGVVLSSLADAGSIVLKNGIYNTMHASMQVVLGDGISKIQNKELLQTIGFVLNKKNGQRAKSYLDHTGTGAEPGAITKLLEGASQTFGNLSFFNHWQDLMQEVAGTVAINRILKAVDTHAKTGKMSRKDLIELNATGVGREHWATIHKEFKRTGGVDEGVYYTNYADWDVSDPKVAEAQRAFFGAIRETVVGTIVEPTAGDLPLFASKNEWMKTIFQFKSFEFASTNKVLVSGLSRNDQEFYQGVVTMLAFGAMSYAASAKSKRPNEPVDLSFDKVAVEAIDRSGLLAVIMEGTNIGTKMLGIGGTTRYQSRGIVGSLLGPTYGLSEELVQMVNTISNAAQGKTEMTTKDVEKFMRLAPFQNLFYLNYLNKRVAKKVGTSLGFEERD